MPAPTNFTLFSLFFQFFQVFRQLVYVGVGESVGFGKGATKLRGCRERRPQTAAFGGQVRGPGQGGGVEVAPPLLFAGDAALFLQPGQQGQQRCAGAGAGPGSAVSSSAAVSGASASHRAS